jgi:hypothetical protein
MRVLFVEEALRDGVGHWPAYIGDLARGFRDNGDEVDVLVHTAATDEVVEQMRGVRGLRRSCWDDSRSRGAIGGLTHNLAMWQDLTRFLRSRSSYNWILALTIRAQHVLAYLALAHRLQRIGGGRLMLLFVQGQGEYAGPGRPTSFAQNAGSRLMKMALRMMNTHVASGRVVLAAETAAMKAEYERFSGLPFRLFPHPASLRRLPDVGPAGPELTFVSPGFARHEKGSDVLQDAIIELFRATPELPARFILQWLQPFKRPDGSTASPSEELLQNPRVQVIDRKIEEKEYAHFLHRSDFAVLPYRPDSYHARVSRVAIEASCIGKPLLVSEDTWLETHVRQFGGGLTFRSDCVPSLMATIREATESHSDLTRQAQSRAADAREYYSVGHFRETLLMLDRLR